MGTNAAHEFRKNAEHSLTGLAYSYRTDAVFVTHYMASNVARGPVSHCAEGVDNPDVDLHARKLDSSKAIQLAQPHDLVSDLEATGYAPQAAQKLSYPIADKYWEIVVKLIPYFAFANPGTNGMPVWLLEK